LLGTVSELMSNSREHEQQLGHPDGHDDVQPHPTTTSAANAC